MTQKAKRFLETKPDRFFGRKEDGGIIGGLLGQSFITRIPDTPHQYQITPSGK